MILLIACASRSLVPPDPLPDSPRRGVTVRIERTLPGPPEEVWPHLTDPVLLSQWSRTQITAHRLVDGDPSAPGAVRQVIVQAWGTRTLYEVVEQHIPSEHFRYRVFSGGGLKYHHGTISLTESSGDSALQWEVRLTPNVPGTGLLIRRSLRRQFRADLDGLTLTLSARTLSAP